MTIPPDWTRFLARTARTATAADLADAIRLAHGRAATREIANQAGIARSTARTWLRATPPSRVDRLRDLVADSIVTAVRLRRAQVIHVGTAYSRISVFYKNDPDKNEGTRPIPSLPVTANVAAYLGDAANDLLSDDMDSAMEALSDAIICGYEDGLEDTLGVTEWDLVDIE